MKFYFKNKTHRKGQPDDYISKCTNIDYNTLDYDKDSHTIFEIVGNGLCMVSCVIKQDNKKALQ